MSGEELGNLLDILFENNIKDAFYTPIYMKKNRPAIKLEVIIDKKNIDKISEIIFKESSTIGMRIKDVDRITMKREIIKINTEYGIVSFKKSSYKDIIKITPEFDDCKRISKEKNIPLIEVIRKLNKYYNMEEY